MGGAGRGTTRQDARTSTRRRARGIHRGGKSLAAESYLEPRNLDRQPQQQRPEGALSSRLSCPCLCLCVRACESVSIRAPRNRERRCGSRRPQPSDGKPTKTNSPSPMRIHPPDAAGRARPDSSNCHCAGGLARPPGGGATPTHTAPTHPHGRCRCPLPRPNPNRVDLLGMQRGPPRRSGTKQKRLYHFNAALLHNTGGRGKCLGVRSQTVAWL